ncbi:MFS transporter [Actinomadura fulvescens]|uniref:MFS transporter n=1 Tax=Actinomadura fulvescens TaxID=46160 RepID=A0ABN3PU53_9ACTN
MRRAWLYWGLGALCYLVALFHRTSLSVAADQAAERFHVGPGALGLFTGLQLGVYLALQIPAGLVADRWGPRRVLTMAALALAGGALLLSMSGSLWEGLAARALTGFGDAFMFVSTLQLAARWFPRQYALVAGLTGLMGALGQVVSALPLTAMLHSWGWTGTFAGAAGLTVVIAVVTAFGVRDGQPAARDGEATVRGAVAPVEPVGLAVRRAWALAGTRRAFWGHFVLMGQFVAFSALWGGPWLTRQGLSAGEAGGLLMLCPLAMAVVSFAGGRVIAGNAARREAVIGTWLGLSLVAWLALVAVPQPMPLPLVVVVLLLVGGGGGGGPLVFDLARTANPAHRSGTAAGVVNTAGFACAVFAQVVVGLVLDLTGTFRLAFLPVLVVLAAAVVIGVNGGRRSLVSS